MPVQEIPKGPTICPNCQNYVKLHYTPGGLSYCPICQYSPTLNRVVVGTTTTDQHGFVPPFPRQPN